MKKRNRKNNKKTNKGMQKNNTNLISGLALLGVVGGVALFAPTVAHADEVMPISDEVMAIEDETGIMHSPTALSDQDILESFVVSLNDIETEEQLVDLVLEMGSQVLIDEETGEIFICYLTEEGQIEVLQVTEEEIAEIIEELGLIGLNPSVEAVPYGGSQEQTGGVPQEYWRGGVPQEQTGGVPQEYWRGGSPQEEQVETRSKKEKIEFGSEEAEAAIQRAKEFKNKK